MQFFQIGVSNYYINPYKVYIISFNKLDIMDRYSRTWLDMPPSCDTKHSDEVNTSVLFESPRLCDAYDQKLGKHGGFPRG